MIKGRKLKVFYARGHVSYHLTLYDKKNNILSTGEVPGFYFPEVNVCFPSIPPPEFDLIMAENSINRLQQLDIIKFLYIHFGPVRDPPSASLKAKEMLIN